MHKEQQQQQIYNSTGMPKTYNTAAAAAVSKRENLL
jgi:hypothetical protein